MMTVEAIVLVLGRLVADPVVDVADDLACPTPHAERGRDRTRTRTTMEAEEEKEGGKET